MPKPQELAVVRNEALRCRTAAQALSAPTLRQLAVHNSEEQVVMEAALILDGAMQLFDPKRRMSADHCTEFAWQLMSDYPHESLADINAFSKGCAMSKYDDGEFYASVDLPRMAKWWRKYLEEKAEARERAVVMDRTQREREATERIASIDGLMDTVRIAAHDYKQQTAERNERIRLGHLRDRVEWMTDVQLRQWWKKENAEGRALIEAEAGKRGLAPQVTASGRHVDDSRARSRRPRNG